MNRYKIIIRSPPASIKVILRHPPSISNGDMKKAVYDTNDDGKVDFSHDSEKLGGIEANQYVKFEDLENLGGGDMVKAIYDTNHSGVVDNAERLDGKTLEELDVRYLSYEVID